jgi:hypothetical protein
MEKDFGKNMNTKRQGIILPGFIFISKVYRNLLVISHELICVIQFIVILK